MIEKYNSKEISNLDFFKLLYQVRRIEYNNLMIEDIDINDLIDTVEIRTININKTKSKNEITLKDLLLLLSIRDKIIQEIEEAIPSIEKEITPNSIGIERDITNIDGEAVFYNDLELQIYWEESNFSEIEAVKQTQMGIIHDLVFSTDRGV